MTGLSSTGFTLLTQAESQAEIEALLKDEFGTDIDLRPESVFGQLVGIFSKRESEIWTSLYEVYMSLNPDFASGLALDNIAALNNIIRNGATQTITDLIVYGDQGTAVPLATIFEDSTSTKKYETLQAVTIDAADARFFRVEPNTTVAGAYSVTINGTTYTYTSGGSLSKEAIVDQLVSVIGAGASKVDGKLEIVSTVDKSFSVNSRMSILQIGTNVQSVCQEYGAVPCPIGSVDSIVTTIAGLQRVSNVVAGVTGKSRETDGELRLRREKGLLNSIVKTITSIDDVVDAKVYENTTDVVDGLGINPNSIWCIVIGGSNAEVAKAISSSKAAGIGMKGSVTYELTSEITGSPQTIKFDRPAEINPVIVITYTITEEDQFPTNGVQLMKDALVAYSNGLKIGQDVVYSRLFVPLNSVNSVQIDSLTIGGGTSSISVTGSQVARIRAADITITETP